MGTILPDDLETVEIRLLIDLCSYNSPFLLNEAFETFNHGQLSKLEFLTHFFGLQTLKLVRVENLPSNMVVNTTSITYIITSYGKDVVAYFKSLNVFFKEDEN